MKNLESILKNFLIKGEVKEITPFGNGLINDTFKVSTHTPTTPDYILQKINHHVFQNVEILQHNIRLVTTHLREKLLERGEKDVERKALTFIDTEDGKNYWFDGENYWRVMLFIPNAKTFEAVTPEYAYYVRHWLMRASSVPERPVWKARAGRSTASWRKSAPLSSTATPIAISAWSIPPVIWISMWRIRHGLFCWTRATVFCIPKIGRAHV